MLSLSRAIYIASLKVAAFLQLNGLRDKPVQPTGLATAISLSPDKRPTFGGFSTYGAASVIWWRFFAIEIGHTRDIEFAIFEAFPGPLACFTSTSSYIPSRNFGEDVGGNAILGIWRRCLLENLLSNSKMDAKNGNDNDEYSQLHCLAMVVGSKPAGNGNIGVWVGIQMISQWKGCSLRMKITNGTAANVNETFQS